MYSWPNGSAPEPRLTVPATPGKSEVLIATFCRLSRVSLAPPPTPPRQFWVLKQTVPLKSGRVSVLVPLVDTPVKRKLLVAGVPEVPERRSWPNGNEPEPRLIAPAVPGSREVFIATPTRLDKAALAPLLEQFPLSRQIVPVASGKVRVKLPAVEAGTIVIIPPPADATAS